MRVALQVGRDGAEATNRRSSGSEKATRKVKFP